VSLVPFGGWFLLLPVLSAKTTVCSFHSVVETDVSVLVMVTFSHGFDLCDKAGED